MTRRALLQIPVVAAARREVEVPVVRLLDRRSALHPPELARFRCDVWDQAARDLDRGGISLRTIDRTGEVRRYPSGRPKIVGRERAALNVVLTDQIPLAWNNGRGLAGVSTIDEGFHTCVIAVREAHPHRVPFLVINTVLHELLHALLGDVFAARSGMMSDGVREARIEWCATQLWLFGNGSEVRRAAAAYVKRLAST